MKKKLHSKIKTEEEIVAISREHARAGKVVVAVSGTFDILHRGHVHFLEESKKQGDILIALMNTDASVKRYKGVERPIVPLADRMAVVAGLSSVDYIVPFDEDTPIRLLRAISAHFFCNGSDWGKDSIEKEACKIRVIPLIDGHSTTRIVEKIKFLHTTGTA